MIHEESLEAAKKVIRELILGSSEKEQGKRDWLLSYLRKMFPNEKDEAKIDEFCKGSEKTIKIITENNEKKTGFQDIDLGTTTIEWKYDLTKKESMNTGKKELKQYTSGKMNINGYSDQYIGILTDGLKWIAYSVVAVKDKAGYSESDIELEMIETIELKSEDEAPLLYSFIKKYVIDQNRLIITAKALKEKFGENTDINKKIVNEIKKIIDEVIKSDKSVVEYITMWNIYKQYNMNLNNDIGISIYAQNLYLVILTRILAARLLEMDRLDTPNDEWIKEILNGRGFVKDFKISNFVEKDMYYWIIDDLYIDKFIGIARELYAKVSLYDFLKTNKDSLLHLIYEEIIPNDHRKEYGQKSTDGRLCDNIISRLDNNIIVGKKYIEPAVGSGSIYRSLINKVKSKMREMDIADELQLKMLQEDVVGVDIDPISVILAKCEWIITNADIIKSSKNSIHIPIYHADSLFSNEYKGNGDDYYSIQLGRNANTYPHKQEIAIIKKDIVSNVSLFYNFLDDCDKLAGVLIKENDKIEEMTDEDIQFSNKYIINQDYLQRKIFEDNTKKICMYFCERRKSINNEIWKSLLFNNNIPQLLFDSFDMVVSNLPWLALSSLPQVAYRDDLKKLSVDYMVRATEESNHHQEIATVFALRCIDKFLKNEGIAAFVMPGTIISGDHHTLFRKEKFKEVVDANFEELWYIPREINPFNISACVLFMSKGHSNDEFGIRNLNSLSNWNDVPKQKINLLVINKKNTWTIKDKNNLGIIDNYYAEMFRQGADLFPRTAVFIQGISNISKLQNNDEVFVTTDKYAVLNVNGKKLKGRSFHGFVNRKYIFTTTISEMLLPYYICKDKPMIVLPIAIDFDEKDEMEKIKIVSNKEMIQKGENNTAIWFEQFDKFKEFEKNDYRYFLNVRNKLTDQTYFKSRYIVHLGASGTYPCAALEKVNEDSLKFIADQTTYVTEIYEEMEAYYLVGMLNSQYICNEIDAFQSEGAFEKRHIHKLPFVFVPKYDYSNAKQVEIAELTKSLCEKIASSITEEEEAIEYGLASRRKKLKDKYCVERNEIEKMINSL